MVFVVGERGYVHKHVSVLSHTQISGSGLSESALKPYSFLLKY